MRRSAIEIGPVLTFNLRGLILFASLSMIQPGFAETSARLSVWEKVNDACWSFLERPRGGQKDWRSLIHLSSEERFARFQADPKVQRIKADSRQRLQKYADPAHQAIFETLEDPEKVFWISADLETQVKDLQLKQGRRSIRAALNQILSRYESEAGFAPAGEIDGLMTQEAFLSMLKDRRLFSDRNFIFPRRMELANQAEVGDVNLHGEWVHRLQWYVVMRSGDARLKGRNLADVYASLGETWLELFDNLGEGTFRAPHVFTVVLGRYFFLVS